MAGKFDVPFTSDFENAALSLLLRCGSGTLMQSSEAEGSTGLKILSSVVSDSSKSPPASGLPQPTSPLPQTMNTQVSYILLTDITHNCKLVLCEYHIWVYISHKHIHPHLNCITFRVRRGRWLRLRWEGMRVWVAWAPVPPPRHLWRSSRYFTHRTVQSQYTF